MIRCLGTHLLLQGGYSLVGGEKVVKKQYDKVLQNRGLSQVRRELLIRESEMASWRRQFPMTAFRQGGISQERGSRMRDFQTRRFLQALKISRCFHICFWNSESTPNDSCTGTSHLGHAREAFAHADVWHPTIHSGEVIRVQGHSRCAQTPLKIPE